MFAYQVCVTSGAEHLAFQPLEAGSIIVERALEECEPLRKDALLWLGKYPKRYASKETDPTKAPYFKKIAENPEGFLVLFDDMIREKWSAKIDKMHADPDFKPEPNPPSASTEKKPDAQD